jgi:hypothetical protein
MKCRIHTLIKIERKRNDCSSRNLEKLEEQCIKNIMKNKKEKKNELSECECENK